MYVYKKSDKNRENRYHISEGIRYKSLWNKAEKIETEIRNYFFTNNLMFEGEDEETKRAMYRVVDLLKEFRENLKLKNSFEEGD